jgi:ABC-type glycerol-3-phosphate transport system permease component
MPIITTLQRKSPAGKLLIGSIYVLLSIGAIGMVYPFLLMLSGSVKSGVDQREFDVIPKFVYDDTALFRKFEEQRYFGLLDSFNVATRYHDQNNRSAFAFDQLTPPEINPGQLSDFHEFMKGLRSWPRHFYHLGHGSGFKAVGEVTLEFQKRMQKDFPDLPETEFTAKQKWEDWLSRNYIHSSGPLSKTYDQLVEDLPDRYFIPVSVEGYFVSVYLRGKYGAGSSAIQKINEKWGRQFKSIFDITLSSQVPTHPGEREDWWAFVRESLPARFMALDSSLLPPFRAFLRERYPDLGALNSTYKTNYSSWDQVPFPYPESIPLAYSDMEDFIKLKKPAQGISMTGPEFSWRDFLQKKYGGDLQALNAAHGTQYASFETPQMPTLQYEWDVAMSNRKSIVWESLTRNYRIVWDYLSSRGNAFKNTIIFCALNVLTALIVNPLAAYALSRFQPRWGYAALFVLMATMAFPGEVTQIPSFLMLREMGLLNTFIALVIPAAANGYSIFLLKGFFDSLPQELYEAATIDGASEIRTFLTITLPLSAPILAVIALHAFTHAYGAFMFALLVCQDPQMWTLMVHIFQLQESFITPIVFAALVLAAIPTLLMFILCQKVIMRGIVIPVEK